MLIKLGKKEFKARVTLDTIMRIETAPGKGVVKIAYGLQEADISMSDILQILTPVIRAGGNDVNEKDIGQAVFDAGLTEGIRVAAEIIALTLNSSEEEGNEQTAAT